MVWQILQVVAVFVKGPPPVVSRVLTITPQSLPLNVRPVGQVVHAHRETVTTAVMGVDEPGIIVL